jgi:hypothetical protein
MNSYYTLDPLDINYAYQPQAQTNNNLLKNANITSNWSYRQYIQKNANSIMKNNTMQYINASGNNPYSITNNEKLDTNPYLYSSIHDTNEPVYKSPVNSDLKQEYLTKQRMKARMVAPYIPTNDF